MNLIDVEFWKVTGIIIGGITALAGLIAVIYRWLKGRLGKVRNWVGSLNKAIEELSPNGGYSIRDRITRIDGTIQMNAARVSLILSRDPAPIYECAPDGSCTFANRALCDLFDLDREQMMGSGWMEALVPHDRERTYDLWMSAVKKRIPYEAEYSIRSGGRILLVVTKADPMFSASGELIGYQGHLQQVRAS